MKNFGKMIFGAALIASFASCTNETNFGQESAGQVEEGIPTYARIKLSVNQMGSRAGLSRAAAITDGNESALKGGVRILIFDKNNVLETQAIVDKEITSGTEIEELIATTTGYKTIYAIANPKAVAADEAIKNITTGMTLSAFQNLQLDAVKQETQGGASEVLIAKADNFLMVGSTTATLASKTGQEYNPVSIDVIRLASKVAMKMSEAAKKSDLNFVPANTAVTVDNAKFQLAQNNKQSFVYVAPNNFSPNGADTQAAADFENEKVFSHLTVGDWKTTTWTDELGTKEFTAGDLTMNNFIYTSENINQTPRVGNITFAMIQVKLTPTKFTDENGTLAGDGTFYAVAQYTKAATTKADQIVTYHGIYSTEQKANEAITKLTQEGTHNCSVITYTAGTSYYRLNLRDLKKTTPFERYALKRNSYYQVLVNGINNPGVSNVKDLFPSDQTTPAEETTNIKATIKVADWTDIQVTEPLG